MQQLEGLGRPESSWRVVDPASGAGVFGLAVVRKLVAVLRRAGMRDDDARDHVLNTSIYLVDADPLAVAVARCLLLSEFGASASAIVSLERHVVCGDAVIGGPAPEALAPGLGGFDWFSAFPEVFADGGFDAVVGNPPWGAIKPSAREYAATVDRDLLRLDGRSMRARLDQ